MKKNGFTLVELMAGLFVGSIIVLTIGSASSIAIDSFERNRREAEVYNDIYFGFGLVEHAVRNSSSVKVPSSGTLIADHLTFSLREIDDCQQPSPLDCPTCKCIYNFIYTDGSGTRPMLSGASSLSLNFDPTLDLTGKVKFIIITLAGVKDSVSFNFSNSIKQRN